MACKNCGMPWSADVFYASIKTFCRECWKAHVRERRRTTPAVQEYERERAKTPHRRAAARKNVVNWRKKFPDKYTALTALGNAIRDKRATRGRACTDCGSRENVFGIHPDYSKPLNVVWRCALCHHRGRFAATSVDARANA